MRSEIANQAAWPPAALSRRGLFIAGLTIGTQLLVPPTGALAGGGEPADPAYEVYHGVRPGDEPALVAAELAAPPVLRRIRSLGDATLYYEVNQARTRFTFEENFFDQLRVWYDRIGSYVPRVWGGAPSRIYTYGALVAKPGYHGQGRAFDIASVHFTTRRGTRVKRFDCRYDQWRHRGYAERREIRARYWALAASLHHRFQHVLTYLYNGAHHNHIHVDNAAYGRFQEASLRPSASAQVQHVQACCRYVWNLRTPITDKWDARTERDTAKVLRRIGATAESLVDSNENWRRFNHATLLHGTGRQQL